MRYEFKITIAIFSLLVIFISCSPTGKAALKFPKDQIASRIINGKPASKGQFPWQVAIFVHSGLGEMFCSGALISDQWVLTAGHCVTEVIDITLQMGSTTLGEIDDDRVTVDTTEYYRHKNYTMPEFGLKDDIALIKMSSPINLKSDIIQPITLDDGDLPEVNADAPVTVSGWGKRRDAQLAVSNLLYYVNLTTVSTEECKAAHKSLPEGVLCCKGETTESICNGDSGGPLVMYTENGPVHVGVVSFRTVESCETRGIAGFARTSFYRNWIRDTSGI